MKEGQTQLTQGAWHSFGVPVKALSCGALLNAGVVMPPSQSLRPCGPFLWADVYFQGSQAVD